ncbi:MAG: antibiotic biosynthesis monooxygenase [Anaerolineae bacterium]
MISVGHKFQESKGQSLNDEVTRLVRYFKTKEGFSHYRLFEPLTSQSYFVLLTFWQSSKHYKRATRQ